MMIIVMMMMMIIAIMMMIIVMMIAIRIAMMMMIGYVHDINYDWLISPFISITSQEQQQQLVDQLQAIVWTERE